MSIWIEVGEKRVYKLKDINKRELITIIPIAFFVLFLGVYPAPLINLVKDSMQDIIEIIRMYV